jgi:hypothetical protein
VGVLRRSGRYVAPPHEKLLVNVLDMAAYLESKDLSGARVEARRLAVTARYLKERGGLEARSDATPAFAFGAPLAGYSFEKSGDAAEARRWYDDAARAAHLQFAHFDAAPGVPPSGDDAEVLLVVGWGRVPHRVAERVPMGLALARASGHVTPHDRDRAAKLEAEGLAWVSFPTLAPSKPPRESPLAVVDERAVTVAPQLDVASVVEAEWRSIEGAVMAAAISRAVARHLAGKAAESLAHMSSDERVRAAGLVASLVLQIALAAADTPDTRSWETLPARLSVVRVRLPPGRHTVAFASRGYTRRAEVDLAPGGFDVVSFIVLR